jgi:hypothetical protein
LVGGQTRMPVDLARRPANFDQLEPAAAGETEVEARIVG